MKLFQFALLLLVQLSPIFGHVEGVTVPGYECKSKEESSLFLQRADVHLTKGCVFGDTTKDSGIMFDIGAMYRDAAAEPIKKTPVVISITEAEFINSFISLVNAHLIPNVDTQVPLQFTMIKTKMSGKSTIDLGTYNQIFKLPPNSRIRISESQLTISSTGSFELFQFFGLQLLTGSSIEITNNVITMACDGCDKMAVFILRDGPMIISGKSSFTLQNNTISMNGQTSDQGELEQCVWYQDRQSSLTISQTSTYTWASNTINMVAHNVKDVLKQHIWFLDRQTSLTISVSSIYTWVSNIISIVAYAVTGNVGQIVWFQETATHQITTSDISGGSSMVWRGNCVGMAHEVTSGRKAGKKHVFGGIWSITERSELLLDGNNITTTDNYGNDKYVKSGSGVTQLVLGTIEDTDITITTGGKVTIQNTKVYSNAADGATGTMLWVSPLLTSKASVNPTAMIWTSFPVKGVSGVIIPTLDRNNLRQYMCNGLPPIPPTGTVTPSLVPIPSPETNPVSPNLGPTQANPNVPKPTDSNNAKPKPSIGGTTPNVPKPVSPNSKPIPASTSKTDSDTTITTNAPETAKIPQKYNIPPVDKTDSNNAKPKPSIGGTTPNVPKPVSPNSKPVPASTSKTDLDTTIKTNAPETVNATTSVTEKSATAILSTIPAVLITSMVFLYLYNW